MTIQTLYNASTGMSAMQTKLDVIANNLANVQTTAFKSDRLNFEDLLYQQEKLPGALDAAGQRTPTGIETGTGVRVQSTQTNQTQGTMQTTGNQLDLAIQGNGFFRVVDPSGNMMYTRAGNFSQNANGLIVTTSANIGRILQPQMTIPKEAIAISVAPDGTVSAQMPNQSTLQTIGQIELSTFINPAGLLKMGENLYQETDASGTVQNTTPNTNGVGSIVQGSLEASNVEPVQQLIDLITTQRSFEMNSQVIQAGDQMLEDIVTLARNG
jgi:flagellar basal-body rod protein FlgG